MYINDLMKSGFRLTKWIINEEKILESEKVNMDDIRTESTF